MQILPAFGSSYVNVTCKIKNETFFGEDIKQCRNTESKLLNTKFNIDIKPHRNIVI